MKIAIINITGGGMSGGYRKYLSNIIPRMAKHPDVESLICASPSNLNVKDWFEPLSNVRFLNCGAYRFIGQSRDSKLKDKLNEFSPDVLFVPVERIFRFKEIPTVNMIQNMEPFVSILSSMPFFEKIKNLVQVIDSKKAINKADRVIAISKFVRDFLNKNWNISNDKIGLVYHGTTLNNSQMEQRSRIIPDGWDGDFLFTAGSIRPHRGLEDVIYAVKYLSGKFSNTKRLLIAGSMTKGMLKYKNQLKQWIQTQNMSSNICWAGQLNEMEMTWCYRNCRAFVMTSRVEACPNIALEAMSHGCICIAANNPPLPEIFKDSAIFYSPRDSQSLAKAIEMVCSWDNNQREKVSKKAINQASKFSWNICVDRTLRELAKVVWQ